MKIRGICQFCDVNGLPYAGGKLNAYALGTTTHANLYKDEACTIPHTWPARLDTRGCIKAFANQNISLELFDKNDNRIDAWDEKLGLAQDAPSDGKQYCRKNGSWQEIVIPNPEWNGIQNKPSTFTPASHTHNIADITNMPTIIPEAPEDGKQYARKDRGWVEVEGGGGADNTFIVTPGAIAALTATPTPFTDIKTAFQASKVIQAHAIVNGEGVYGYLQAFQFNSTTNKGTAVFAFYNSNPDYLNGTDFIITCSYDASASPTDTWEQNIQIPIPAPAASDANKVLKANSSGNAVGWDKVKSSELTNDAGFLTDAPADGKQYCRKDNAWAEVIGGGSEGGYTSTILWDYQENGGGVIKYGTNQNYTLNDSIENYDLLVVEVVSHSSDIAGGPSSTWYGTCPKIVSVEELKNALKPYYFHYTSHDTRSSRFHIEGTSFVCEESVSNCNGLVKLYGISLRGKSNVYSTDEVAIGKWIDGKTIYRKVISVPSFFYAQRWVSIGSIDNAGFPTKAEYICNYHKVQGDASYFCGDIGCRFVGNDVQVFSERFTGKTSTQYTSYIIVEYTKNE